MRTIIDLPEEQIKNLDRLADGERISRAEAIRRAIAKYLDEKLKPKVSAFGLWKDKGIDGLKFQREIREDRDDLLLKTTKRP